ncbi:MAG: shikimate kinase AroL [Enterobacteriaceae bacterium]|nr:shikimate kinase AroL [Enterobacteriaceae bacterium]
MKQTIFIVGARGAGKTTIGNVLAEALSYKFVDTDDRIQVSSGMTIAELVKQHGWDYFRQLESQTLHAVSQKEQVISTGGGMVLAAENRQYMRQNGIVIYLQAPASVLTERLSLNPEDSQRPSLTGKSITEEMESVLAQREQLYCECAHFIADATRTIENIVFDIRNYIFSHHKQII